jgi:anaerobic magnesium-protoporphyrin IX monomethyl ester cyclase
MKKNPKNILFVVPNSDATVIMPPLGIGYLASIARNMGHSVQVLNCLRDNISLEDFEEFIKSGKFDLIGISMMTFNFAEVKRYCSLIKNTSKGTKIILGGSHASGDYQDILIDIPDADFAVRGEGELGFKEFLNQLESDDSDLRKVPSLVWREGGKVVVNDCKVVENLDDIEFPAWDLINPNEYPLSSHTVFATNFPVAPMVVTRGCPFQCTFCAGRTVTGYKIRKRSVDNVMKEVDLLVKQYGVKEIHIEDDNFTFYRDFVVEFCEELIKRNYGISWALPNGLRLDKVDDELIALMERSGLHYISVGIEFGTDRMLKLTKKNLNVETIKEKVNMISKHKGIRINGFFLIGIPDETKEDILATIELSKNLPLDDAQFSNFIPLPGSPLFDRLKAEGKLVKNYENFLVHKIPYVPEGMTEGELKQLQRKAFIGFYLRPKSILKILLGIKNLRQIRTLLGRVLDSWS